ncbi:unnamed protein product [Medioppia subpectinata]|uniref:N-terminal acetyltransferase B complex subunit MDM20 homolog n=1 Tax=Medioppia subpectinata TaxID=1979941 RepID=A0A7R9Q5G8_9ACAR|nr:unnamed protein product [Medioppia subpectinata]CAG2112305.1 unnamed protein product [Medioppia subpectinata]
MMAKNVDNSHINERRLRPIYDCLDNGNNKKALQEADKVLKKQKDLLCAKVLKSLALLRMGRQEESLRHLKEVHADCPTDDSTLQAMTICYRELHKAELIADAYENAVKKDPSNEELHSHLFMAYVRLSDYKKQHLTALGLYKLKPKNPYYFWAVMSILMQAISDKESKLAHSLALPLAEKMCKRFLEENKIEAEAEVELYLMTLEKQKKYNEMLSVMDSPVGAKLSNHLDFLSKRRADLLRRLDRYEDAFNAYKQLIDNNIDQIDYYTELIDIAFVLNEKSSAEANDNQNSGVINSGSVSNGGANERAVQPRLRGPYLAKMVLFGRLEERQRTQADVEHLIKQMANSVIDLLFEYFVEFGSKQAAIYDMLFILEKFNLTEVEIQTLTLQMKQSIANITENYSDLNSMHRHMTYLYICHYLGQNDGLSASNRLDFVQHLGQIYEKHFENIIAKSDIMTTEPQSTDPFVTLMACVMFVNKEFDDNILIQTIVILENGLIKSPANFHFKLLLVKLYNMIGAVSASHTWLESLDIKHIQYDSLGYIFATQHMIGAHFNTSSQLLGNMLKFYSSNVKDTLDYMISCYKFGSFTKVEEILLFRDRLTNSLQYCLSAVDRMILDMILETKKNEVLIVMYYCSHSSTENIINYMEIDVENDKFVWNEISDNRDFSVIRSHHQKSESSVKESQKRTFDDEILWLKIRNLLIRAIAASHNLVNDEVKKKGLINNNNTETNGTEKRNNIDVLSELSVQFREYISCVHSSTFAESMLSLDEPNESRIVSFSKLNYFEVLSELIDFIISLNNEPKEGSLSSDPKSGDIFASIVDKLEESVNTCKTLFSVRSTLELLTNTMETLSLSIILLGICQSIMKYKMNINSSNKKNRRKKEVSTAGSAAAEDTTSYLVKTYASLVSKFEASAQRIDTILKAVNISSVLSERFVLDGLSTIGGQRVDTDSNEY